MIHRSRTKFDFWCGLPCWASGLAFVAALLMVGALVSPWYFTSFSTQGENEVSVFRYFYWDGMHTSCTANHKKGCDQYGQLTASLHWNNFPSQDLAVTYMVCQVLAFIALVVSLGYGLATCGLHILDAYVVFYPLKWMMVCVGLVALVSTIVSWALFFRISGILGSHEAFYGCDVATDSSVETWCDGSFIGYSTHEPDLSPPITESRRWGPFVGWVLAVMATLPTLNYVVLGLFVKTSQSTGSGGGSVQHGGGYTPISDPDETLSPRSFHSTAS